MPPRKAKKRRTLSNGNSISNDDANSDVQQQALQHLANQTTGNNLRRVNRSLARINSTNNSSVATATAPAQSSAFNNVIDDDDDSESSDKTLKTEDLSPINNSDDDSFSTVEKEPLRSSSDDDNTSSDIEIIDDDDGIYREFLKWLNSPNGQYVQADNSNTIRQLGVHETKKLFDGSQRDQKYGSVKIQIEEVTFGGSKKVIRPTKVTGLILITKTKGRASAPEPIAQLRVSQSPAPKSDVRTERDTGRADVQKGHIMALELGGPDIRENIVPQWAQWQSNGVWRQMERQVLKIAENEKKNGNFVLFDATVNYQTKTDLANANLIRVAFPVGFTVTLTILDQNKNPISGAQLVFDNPQAQDLTDDKMFLRQAQRAGEIDLGEDWNKSASKGKGGFKKTGVYYTYDPDVSPAAGGASASSAATSSTAPSSSSNNSVIGGKA